MSVIRQISKVVPASLKWGFNPSAAVFTRGLKSHTGIAGLDVDPNARETLKTHLEKILESIKIIPEDAEYRRNVEATVNHKLSVVNSDVTDEEAEDQLDAQLEQYIKFTKDELSLIPKMAGRHFQPSKLAVQSTLYSFVLMLCRMGSLGSALWSQGQDESSVALLLMKLHSSADQFCLPCRLKSLKSKRLSRSSKMQHKPLPRSRWAYRIMSVANTATHVPLMPLLHNLSTANRLLLPHHNSIKVLCLSH